MMILAGGGFLFHVLVKVNMSTSRCMYIKAEYTMYVIDYRLFFLFVVPWDITHTEAVWSIRRSYTIFNTYALTYA